MKSFKNILYEAFKKKLLQSKLQVFFIGTMIGLILSWLYLLTGGEIWWSVPLWAEIVFYPGFPVGWYCYDLFGGNLSFALLFGSLSVGLFYGIAFVVVLSIWSLLAQMGKYAIALLCIITIIVGMLFLRVLLHPRSAPSSRLEREFTLTITSDPSGAMVYPLQNYGHGQPDSIGTTPIEFKGSYDIARNGSGYGFSGRGISLESTEEGVLVRLDCIVAKNGYTCQELAPVLATIPKKNARPEQMPSKFKYNAMLIPNESANIKKVGTAVIVNGSFVEVNPPSLKLMEGVYIIDIKSAK